MLPAWLAPAAQSAPAAVDPSALDIIDNLPGIDALGSGVDAPLQPLPAARTGLAAPALGGTTLAPSWFAPVSDSSSSSADAADRAGLPPVFPANFGAAQCVPAYQLAFAITPPPLPVSRGNVNGDVYTVTVSNNSAASVPEISLYVDPNVGFLFMGGSPAATSNLSGTLGLNVTGDGTPGTAFILAVTGDPFAKALAPSETMTFTFRLATDADAKSGQLLTAAIRSGDPSPGECKTAAINIPTVRGNLTILKAPLLQTGSYGEVITWTVTLKNTGLGTIYDAVMADILGAGYAPTSVVIDPAPGPVDLAVNEERSYMVSARIESCTNLTQTAAASWSIGNADGTGTAIQPVRAEADVVFAVGDPDVAVEVGPIPPATYCGPLNATVPVTVTNSGEAARDLALEMAAEGVDVTLPWQFRSVGARAATLSPTQAARLRARCWRAKRSHSMCS